MELRLLTQNIVLVSGNLTKDPDYKVTTGGRGVLHMRVAVNRRYQDKSGEWKDDTAYVPVDVWGEAADRLKDKLKKGSPVHVEGRLRSRDFDDKTSGQKRTVLEVVANRVQFLAKSGAAAGGAPASGEAAKSDEDLEEVPF